MGKEKPLGNNSGNEGSLLSRPSTESTVNRSTRRVQLDITIPNLPVEIQVLGEDWARKREFHVTLIGPGQRLEEEFRGRNPGLSKRNVKALVSDAIDKTLEGKSFRVIPQDELRIAQENDRKTIIRMCEVEGAEAFFGE